MKLTLEWRTPKTDFPNGEYLLANGVMVGSIAWMNDRIESGYMAFSRLPGCEPGITKYAIATTARMVVEKHTNDWFAKILDVALCNATVDDVEALRGKTNNEGAKPHLLQIYDNLHAQCERANDLQTSLTKALSCNNK